MNCVRAAGLTATLKALRHYAPAAADHEAFHELERYTKQARIASWTGSGTILGVGASVGKSVSPTQPVAVPLQTLQELLERAMELAREHNYSKIIVLLNNLDNVEQDHVFGLFHDLRDTLLGRTGWIYVFAAPRGMRQTLATESLHRRISERIAPDLVTLGPLSKEGVLDVVRRRIEAYKLEATVSAPVPKGVIEILYDTSDGEIRYTLNRADGIARLVANELPTLGPIEEELALAALQNIVAANIERLELSERQREVLEAIAVSGVVQPKDYEKFDLNSSSALVNYLRTFLEMGLMERERQGRETFYTPRGDVILYFCGVSEDDA